MRKIILASTSPRRKELLTKAGFIFESVASDYEEDMTLPMPPDELVKFLSKGKAENVAKNYEDAIIISGDTIVYFDGQVFGKPYTSERAKKTLKKLSGNEHSVFTGITVIDTKSKKIISEAIESKIKFKNLSDKEIDEYVKTGEPLDKGGAYDIQTVGSTFEENIGDTYDSIIGLPLEPLKKMLELLGVKP